MKKIITSTALAFTLIFIASVVSAQDTSDKKNTVHIKIEKDEDGKVTKIDTTVTKDQLPALRSYLMEQGIDLQSDEAEAWADEERRSEDENIEKEHKMIRKQHEMFSKEDRARFERDMERLHEDMAKLKKELKEMHLDLRSDDEAFNFDFKMLPKTPMPPKTFYRGHPRVYIHHDDDEDGDGKTRSYSYSYSFSDDEEIPDSLNDGNHIIIRTKKGEGKPELEKEITTKNGDKIYIYKKSSAKSSVKKKK